LQKKLSIEEQIARHSPELDRALVKDLLERLPELKSSLDQHLAENDELLPYVFLPAAVLYLSERMLQGGLKDETLDRFADFINGAVALKQTSSDDLVCIAVLVEIYGSVIWPRMEFLLDEASSRMLHEYLNWKPSM
jgi:hypothetical protein